MYRMRHIALLLLVCGTIRPRSRALSRAFLGPHLVARPLRNPARTCARAASRGFGSEPKKKPGRKAPSSSSLADSCPCLSGRPYDECCGPVHDDFQSADPSPEVLARARYTALAMGKAEFLMDTTHSSNPEHQEDRAAWKKQILRNREGVRFVGINVTKSEPCSEGEHEVSFEAAIEPSTAIDDTPKVLLIRERSIYKRDRDAWFYAEAADTVREVVEGMGSSLQISNYS